MPHSTDFSLVLASGSVYRAELLARLNRPFLVDAADIDETPYSGENPAATAQRLAREKAVTVSRRHANAVVVGSDQVAAVGELHIGKPGDHAHAAQQLRMLSGQSVLFHTALCVLDASNGLMQEDTVTVAVRFRVLSDRQIDAYLAIEKPYDCAGSAKSEGLGIALLESIQSADPTALVGLPLITLISMLERAGYAVLPVAGQE